MDYRKFKRISTQSFCDAGQTAHETVGFILNHVKSSCNDRKANLVTNNYLIKDIMLHE